MGERENGRARGRHARGPFSFSPTTSKRLLRRLVWEKQLLPPSHARVVFHTTPCKNLKLKKIFHDSLKISKFTIQGFVWKTIQAWLGGKSYFSHFSAAVCPAVCPALFINDWLIDWLASSLVFNKLPLNLKVVLTLTHCSFQRSRWILTALEWEACPKDRMFDCFGSEITYWSLPFVIGLTNDTV